MLPEILSLPSDPPISTEHCEWLYGIFGHETSCTRYWTCWNGTATEQFCIGGLLYSEDTHACDWPQNVGGCQKHRKLQLVLHFNILMINNYYFWHVSDLLLTFFMLYSCKQLFLLFCKKIFLHLQLSAKTIPTPMSHWANLANGIGRAKEVTPDFSDALPLLSSIVLPEDVLTLLLPIAMYLPQLFPLFGLSSLVKEVVNSSLIKVLLPSNLAPNKPEDLR